MQQYPAPHTRFYPQQVRLHLHFDIWQCLWVHSQPHRNRLSIRIPPTTYQLRTLATPSQMVTRLRLRTTCRGPATTPTPRMTTRRGPRAIQTMNSLLPIFLCTPLFRLTGQHIPPSCLMPRTTPLVPHTHPRIPGPSRMPKNPIPRLLSQPGKRTPSILPRRTPGSLPYPFRAPHGPKHSLRCRYPHRGPALGEIPYFFILHVILEPHPWEEEAGSTREA